MSTDNDTGNHEGREGHESADAVLSVAEGSTPIFADSVVKAGEGKKSTGHL